MTFDECIIHYHPTFLDHDSYIASFILEHQQQCYRWTIQEFADRCHVSKSSIVRFCQKINLTGYAQLKAMLKWEDKHSSSHQQDHSRIVEDSYQKMIDHIVQADFTQLFQDFDQAKQFIIFGSGDRQARVANEWKRMFLPTGKTMISLGDYEMLPSLKESITKGDMFIFISLSGEKQPLIEFATYLQIKNIPTLSLTRMKSNTLAMTCKHNLYIHSIPIETKVLTHYEITTPYFMLVEILYILYQNYRSVHNSKL